MKKIALLFLIFTAFLSTAQADKIYKLKKNRVQKVKKVLCISPGSKWTPGEKVSKGRYKKKLSSSTKERKACKKLLKRSSSRSLTQFPDPSSITNNNTSSLSVSEVSGTAPTVSEIISLGAENVFFRPGVIEAINNNTPNFDQCNEFWGGASDGQSGGVGACYMAENVVYSVAEIARSGTSLCYMKNFPSAENLEAGAVSLVSGELPDGNIEQIFDAPSGNSSRLVKVNVTGQEEGAQSIFLKIYSQGQNASQGNQYRFDIWFCDDGQSGDAQEYEQTKITAGGEYISTSVHSFDEFGVGVGTVRGLLKQNGENLEFNTKSTRTASFGGLLDSGSNQMDFKFYIQIKGDEVRSKVRDISTHDSEQMIRKGFAIAKFSGSGLNDLRFLEGASKEVHDGESFSSASEYRDSYYASSPDSEYASIASSFSFSGDSFFSTGVEIPDNALDLPCDATADIVVALDMSNAAMQEIGQDCEGDRIDDHDSRFCQSEALENAQQNWSQACNSN